MTDVTVLLGLLALLVAQLVGWKVLLVLLDHLGFREQPDPPARQVPSGSLDLKALQDRLDQPAQ